jgi:hypothetical protein
MTTWRRYEDPTPCKYYCSSPTFSTAALGATKSSLSPKVSEESHSWIDVSELNSSPIQSEDEGLSSCCCSTWKFQAGCHGDGGAIIFVAIANVLSTASKEVIQWADHSLCCRSELKLLRQEWDKKEAKLVGTQNCKVFGANHGHTECRVFTRRRMDPRSSADLQFCAIGKCWKRHNPLPSTRKPKKKKKVDTDSERERRNGHIKRTHKKKCPPSLTTTYAVLIDAL